MSKTTDFRYEVSSQVIGVIDHTKTRAQAETAAQNFIEREPGKTVEIYDRMARSGQPELWEVKACTGAAHSNPMIDHCAVCMPRWGITLTVKRVRQGP